MSALWAIFKYNVFAPHVPRWTPPAVDPWTVRETGRRLERSTTSDQEGASEYGVDAAGARTDGA